MNEDIYQDQIIEWSRNTDHIVRLENIHCRATASNPLCGDKITVEMELDGDLIISMGYQIKGCVLCKASSAILAEKIRGLRFDDLNKMSLDLDRSLKSPNDEHGSFPAGYDLFYPVRMHKSRYSCVQLPFNAVVNAISEYGASGITDGQKRRMP
jgi:nitrogen fixation NifU-like protein